MTHVGTDDPGASARRTPLPKPKGAAMIHTGAMFLVYVAKSGETVLQPWQDVDVSGTPTDPDTDTEMELVGWTLTESPKR